MLPFVFLCFLLLQLPEISHEITCFNCESDFQGALRCKQPCDGEQCAVWKWKSRSELSIKQGCLKGIDEKWTSKIGCRTNHLGASLCVCNDGALCNRVDRAENGARPLPQVRLPAVECISKITSTGFIGARRERICASNYCHAVKTETFIDEKRPDTLNVSNCGDIPEFDFDVRLGSSTGVPGLYPNGCYRVQVEPKKQMIDCICSKNNCNKLIPGVETGFVRCYVGNNFLNTSQIDSKNFCDGDFCLIQNHHGRIMKGCISVNERNTWSHLKNGHRIIFGVEQWLCQGHLCNYDVDRAQKTIESRMRNQINSRMLISLQCSIMLIVLNALFSCFYCY